MAHKNHQKILYFLPRQPILADGVPGLGNKYSGL